VLPAFLAAIGAGPMWLGAIEGIADGLSSFLTQLPRFSGSDPLFSMT